MIDVPIIFILVAFIAGVWIGVRHVRKKFKNIIEAYETFS